MAKVNTIGLAGAVLSLVGAGSFWLYVLMTGYTWGSGESTLARDMKELMTIFAAAYMAGAVLGGLSQMGGFVQLPSVVLGLPLAWYLGYHPLLYLLYLVALLGTALLIAAVFLEHSRSERKFKAPPFSRLAIWAPEMSRSRSRPFTKSGAKRILAVIVVSPIIVAGFATFAWTMEVSTIRVSVDVNGVMFGSTNISFIIDGEVIYTAFLEYDPDGVNTLYAITEWKVSAGTHQVEVDAWNGDELTPGTTDHRLEQRVLPFTTERVYLVVGYGLI